MDAIDLVADKTQKVPQMLDGFIGILKKPALACIPQVINKIASKFSSSVIALFALVYAVYCIKNAVICCFFEESPKSMAFSLAVVAIIAVIANSYLVYKTLDSFENIIKASPCRISSGNVFSVIAFLSVLCAIFSLVGGIYYAFEFKSFQLIIAGVVGAVFFMLLALYSSNTDEFAIVEDQNASAGEDFASIITFFVKVVLRLVPIAVFAITVIGICQCVPELFESYVESHGESNYLDAGSMSIVMLSLGGFLLIGLLPIAAYIYYLINYILLDIIRAVLSLPGKLDELKK